MTLRRLALIILNALAAMLLVWTAGFYTPPAPGRPAIPSSLPPEVPTQPDEPVPETVPLAVAPQDDPLRLVGVMLASDQRSAWVQQGDRALRRITLGDELEGGRVIEISRRSIAINLAGRRRDLLLDPPSAELR